MYKKYEVKDTFSSKIIGVLYLFEDNTFINYGTGNYSDQKQKVIWFTAGRWLGNQEMVMCRTYLKNEDQEQLIGEIKTVYESKQEYLNKMEDYKFLKIDYLDYVFAINKKVGLIDKIKKLKYNEVIKSE